MMKFLIKIRGVVQYLIIESICRLRGENLRRRFEARWPLSHPDPELTWGVRLTGDAFVQKAISFGVFSPKSVVLEVGPGYGRILQSIKDSQVPYRRYMGLDISPQTAKLLSQKFASKENNIGFFTGDAESFHPDSPFDVLLSSLTFKHLYPSFERALHNLAQHAQPGAYLLFDLIPGWGRGLCRDGSTFVRLYTKREVRTILHRIGLTLVAFDTVVHDPEHKRMLVVAKRPKIPTI